MASEWEETTLGDCADWLSGGTPFKGNDAYWSGPIPWVSAKDMKSFRLHDAEDHMSPLAVGKGGKVVPAGTILLLVRGMTLHNDVPICMVTREMAFNQDIKALHPAKNVDGAFLAYWLLAHKPDLLASVDHAGHGTGRLVTGTLKGKAVQLPPLAEQKAIAEVLGALDDKIELNRRMNATLEAMARALFQSWFVDIHPVRAKLDGRQPAGLDSATAALFPDHLEGSPLGHIPKGWSAKSLSEVVEVNPRRTLRTGTIAPYLDMKNLPTQGHSADEVVDREFSSGTKFQNGDTLLARITPCLENGKTGYVDFLEEGQVGWGSTEYIVLAPKPPLPPQFGYLLARSDPLRTHAIHNMTGTSGRQRVPSECFKSFLIAVPPPAIACRFDELTAPLMTEIKANANQSRTLATLRDTLLPKLLSGELSVGSCPELPDSASPRGAKP
ncbi:restriction endonuclease subunit S [Accumulibacter sp.]|uniref:Restriction modification system DNA specificity domain protein n=1 Tax=Accumulibacter regalis TaxID=522306 RepID=C7RSU0_ACCRE|nr:restriction endonuclease subunit S [Accumulibacter sp.]MBN8495614.1 restriction endonuclease subunit S [Accumulibacter sp.]MBO3715978.1 restriction endonuclease subunit S [Accumulibacter sp.]